jgi:preprotein translocase subunit SecE
MALKLYKPGQGYWTRLVTGLAGGLLIVTGAIWLSGKLSVIQSETWRVYIQFGVPALVIIVLGLLLYRFVGTSARSSDFLIATEGEMKKVNWPTRREVVGSTWVVICCVIMLTLLLWISDLTFASYFDWINVIRK